MVLVGIGRSRCRADLVRTDSLLQVTVLLTVAYSSRRPFAPSVDLRSARCSMRCSDFPATSFTNESFSGDGSGAMEEERQGHQWRGSLCLAVHATNAKGIPDF